MLRSLLKSLVVASAVGLAGAASAQTNYAGIYRSEVVPSLYASVHQNGNSLIVALFTTMNIEGSRFAFSGTYGVFEPARLDHWDLITGTVSGNTATLSGESNFGACFATVRAVFNADGSITARTLSLTNTPRGNAQGVNCPAGLTGVSSGLVRVF